jgi:hypothetical protein
MKITVIGMSHVEALRRALPPGQDRIEIINLHPKRDVARYVPGGEWLDAKKAIKPRFKAAMRRDGHFVSMIGGNMHNMIGLIEHPQRYDFLAPGQEAAAVDPERTLIPYDAIRAHLEASVALNLGWIAELARLFSGRRLHLCSPPPVSSAQHIRRFPGVFRSKLALGVTPAPIRMKIYALNGDIYRVGCAEMPVECLPAPATATDAGGFLRADCWNEDATHGNATYGRHLLAQIEEHLAA